MLANRSRDAGPELAVRRLVHAMGLRYRVNARPVPTLRRTADLVFTRQRVGVLIDGCYWRGCPEHHCQPRANADYWSAKMARNQARDAATDEALRAAGWTAALSTADKDIAAKIVSATTELNGRGFSESPETVQALDVPLAPPPDPSYPVNDVIAEATDLDGNHVVLRRGYYDGKRGFGWDKIFHKHGITNPNAFTDLIAHSRPISSKDRELIYKVEVDRAHCSQLFGPIPDCEDTGERLEPLWFHTPGPMVRRGTWSTRPRRRHHMGTGPRYPRINHRPCTLAFSQGSSEVLLPFGPLREPRVCCVPPSGE